MAAGGAPLVQVQPLAGPEGGRMFEEVEEPRHVLPSEPGIEVYPTVQDMIALRQHGRFGDDPNIIVVSPERLDRLIALLRAVKDEILTARADDAEARSSEPPPISNG